MTDYLGSMKRGEARVRLQGARAELLELQKDLSARLAEAERYVDPDLSAQGLTSRRSALAEQARAAVGSRLAQVRGRVERDAQLLADHAEAQRPRVKDDAASLMRLQMSWDRTRMKLEAGMGLRQVLATATAEEALAIREWGPSYAQAQAAGSRPAGMDGLHWKLPDTEGLLRAVDDRLAATSDGYAAAHAAAREAETVMAGVGPTTAHLQRVVAGERSDALGAAIEARMAEKHAAAGYPEPESSDEGAAGDGAA